MADFDLGVVVGPAGHDPASTSLKGWCSAHLNYGPVIGGERVESNAVPAGSRVTAGLGDHPNLLTLSVESGWQGRTRTDIRLINSELAYRMAHLPKLVWVVGFEPTASRFQGEDSDPAELHPETEQLEITAARTAPFVALSVGGQAHRSRVSTRNRRGSFRVVRHDGLFEQEALPVCGTATRCPLYRLPCGQ